MSSVLERERNEKLLWLEKHFTSKIIDYVYNCHGRRVKIEIIETITDVLYFDSKLWYYYKVSYINSNTSPEHYLVYFGHYQPSIFNIKARKYNDIIKFDYQYQLPSTMVAIEDIVDIIYNATINSKAVLDSSDNTLTQIINESITPLYKDLDNNRARNPIEKTTYPMLNNYQFLQLLTSYFGIYNDNITNRISHHGRTINRFLSYYYDKQYYMHKFMPVKAFQSLKKLRDKNIINNKNTKCNYIYHIVDENINDNYKVLVIGHAVRLGKLYKQKSKDDDYFKAKSNNGIAINEVFYENNHHGSIEVDNHYNYTNNYTGFHNEDAIDSSFTNPIVTDNCYNIDEKNIFKETFELNFSNDESLNMQIAHDTEILKNKLRDIYNVIRPKYNLSDIMDIFSNDIKEKFNA